MCSLQNRVRKHAIPYVDYYAAMVDEDGGLKAGLTDDEVHPTLAGYQIMEPIILSALPEITDRQ